MKAFNYCGPDPKPLTNNEAVAIADLVKRLPPYPVIVQIGAYIGASTVAMLETRPDAYIFSIDVKPCLQERANLMQSDLDYRRVVRVLGDSSQMNWPVKVDMLFIDGNHYYEAVKADCDRWLDKVNGLVVFHDYIPDNAPAKNQVYEVVNELFGDVKPMVKAERIIGFER